MQIELKPLQLSDAETLYEFFQKLPASENGKNNRAHGLSKEDFAKWVQSEIDSSQGKNLKPGYVPGTTYVMYVDGVPVGVSNLRHYLNENLQKVFDDSTDTIIIKGYEFHKVYFSRKGDNVEIGCNSVLNPGTIIYPNAVIYPLCVVKKIVHEGEIYKDKIELARL